MKKLLAILLLSFTSSFAFSQSTEDKVWARVETLNKAVFGSKDTVVIKSLVSEKLTYGHSGGNIEDMKMMVANTGKSKTIYKNVTVEKLSSVVVNKSVVVTYILRAVTVDEKGTETPLNISLMQVWGKERGDWKLFARQAVKVNPK
jgi:hypothetical protein